MTQTDFGDKPTEQLLTDEMFDEARARVGMILRPEGPYLTDATTDTLTNFCNGIGDLNPLYRDGQYGRVSRYGGMVGHPMFPYAYGWPGRTRWGFAGVHGFYAGNDWEFFKPVHPGDRISAVERVVGVEEKIGKFSGRFAVQYTEASFLNQNGALVARVLGWCTRHERQAARENKKYEDTAGGYSAEDLERITHTTLTEDERIAGRRTRYFEDVKVGEQLDPICRGPLSLMDTMGFLVGCGRGHTHGVLMKSAIKHPAHYFHSQEAGGGIEYTGIGHHRESIARSVGVPGTYDYGPQRTAWMCSLVTNWMGDDAVLKRLRADMRRFNTLGDVTWCKGKVTGTEIKDGYGLVHLEIWAENQHGQLTAPGIATVALPSRSPQSPILVDGSSIDLQLPTIR